MLGHHVRVSPQTTGARHKNEEIIGKVQGSSVLDLASMANPECQDLGPEDGEDDAIVADAKLPQSSELPL